MKTPTPSRMTIAWDRLDQMALLPQDSSVVIPPPVTTIAWTPLLGPTLFEPAVVEHPTPPGGGEEVVTTPPPTEGGGTSPAGETRDGGGSAAGPRVRPPAPVDDAPTDGEAVPQGRLPRRRRRDRPGARAGGVADESQRPQGEGADVRPDQGPEHRSRCRRRQSDPASVARRADGAVEGEGPGLGDARR